MACDFPGNEMVMFEREILLNRFLLGYFDRLIADIPAAQITDRPPGNGHPPLWVLGHLAWCAEYGETFCGIPWKHESWKEVFGPGSSDDVSDAEQYEKDELVDLVRTGYPRLCETVSQASPDSMDEPHGLTLMKGAPIQTAGDMIAHLLTTHFSFHLSQLSSWRRASGKGPLV